MSQPPKDDMSLSTAISNISAQASVYSPLDLSQRSIRLLRILPDLSRQGHIQCKVRHATVDSEYICLSYVWGPPDEGHPVLFNDELYMVRKNLYTFLRYARKKGFDWLWVDALCIDQGKNRGTHASGPADGSHLFSGQASHIVAGYQPIHH